MLLMIYRAAFKLMQSIFTFKSKLMISKPVQFNKKNIPHLVQYGIIILIVGVFGNLIFSLAMTDRHIFISLQQFRPFYFMLAVLLSLIPWVTNTFRLMIWTRFLGKRYRICDLFKIVLGTDVGSAITPTAIGGGYVKAGMLVQKGLSPGAAASVMTLGSVEDGVFFALALPVAFFMSSNAQNGIINNLISRPEAQYKSILLFISGLLIIISALLFIFNKLHARLVDKIRGEIVKIGQDFSFVYITIGKTGKTRFCLSLLLTAIQWMCRYSVLTVLLISLGITVDPIMFFLVQWFTFAIMTTIPTPGAMAGAEASFYLIYAHLIPKELLGLITTGWRFLTFYLQVGLAIIIIGCINFFNFQK